MGYLGNQNAIPLVIEGLKSLEYRGYDSFGHTCKTKKSAFTNKQEKSAIYQHNNSNFKHHTLQ